MGDPPMSRPAVRMPRIIELNENMSEFYLTADGRATADDGAVQGEQVRTTGKKKDSRKGRRAGKGKKGKGKEKADSVPGEEALTEDIDDASSRTVSDGDINTEPLIERYQIREHPNLPAQDDTSIPYVYVPVLPHYELRTVPNVTATDSTNPGPRIEKHGLFATQPIEAGVRIICEPPLITLPAPGDQLPMLMQAYHALPVYEQDRIWSLNPCDSSVSPMLTWLAKQIFEKMLTLATIRIKPEEERTPEEEEFLADQLPKVAGATDVYRIAARWHAGRYSLVNLSEDQHHTLPAGTPITGLFVETAKLRHSCIPNCHAHYNYTTNRMTVHVTTPIAPGTELTLSYLNNSFYTTSADRRLELTQKFGIKCTCEACDPSSRSFTTHESARVAANGRALLLLHNLTQLSIIDSAKVRKDLHINKAILSDEEPDIDGLRDSENMILQVIKDLKTTGCTGPELIRWYNALVDRIQPRIADELSDGERMTWWRFVCRHAGEAEKIGLRCFGEDSAVAKEMGERLKRLEGLVEGMEKKLGEERIKKREEFIRRNRRVDSALVGTGQV